MLIRSPRRPLLLTASLVAALALGAPVAEAATIHVATLGADNPACGGQGNPCATLEYALTNRVTAAQDTVLLGAGEFTGPGYDVANANAAGDVVQGAGSGGAPSGTVLRHANAGADPRLELSRPLTLRSLSVRVPAGAAAARRGLLIANTAGGSRLEDVAVTIENGSTAPAVVANTASDVVYDRLRVTGNHTMDGLVNHVATGVVVQDSTLTGGTSPVANALAMDGGDAVVRRSRLSRDFAAAGLDPVVEAINARLTVESSLILGGRVGINSQASPPSEARLTLRSVSIDIAQQGVADVPPDRHPIYVRTTMPGAATSTARVERSIFVEPVYAFGEAGSTTKVECVDSLVPLADTALVACGAGAGNAFAQPTAVWVNPFGGDYHLKPAGPGVDGASAAVADGESTTDLEGNPRVLDGNGDCLARIDRGAFELTGHAADPASCQPDPGPQPQPQPQPVAPVLDRVAFLPAAFRARGGAARLRFRLSEPAQVTAVVEQALAGRRAGGRCRKPSSRSTGGRKCTRWVKAGTLALAGKAGTNKPAFSGRLAGRTLVPGRYRARVRATDAGGLRSVEQVAPFRVLPPRR